VRLRGPDDGERAEALIRRAGAGTAGNAATAYAAARAMGATSSAAAHGLSAIGLHKRRTEPPGNPRGGVHVYGDKHPANVRGGIAALRRRHPDARIIAVFEPVLGLAIAHWGWRYARAAGRRGRADPADLRPSARPAELDAGA
jgi:hypothetical protein